jgi:diacylglycerol O-acyltransferase/trehalose O-mycolyltransferase
MSGSASLILAAYHPAQFKYVGSSSGFSTSPTARGRSWSGVAMNNAGGFDANAMWGPAVRSWMR